jgi:hypothetical protein
LEKDDAKFMETSITKPNGKAMEPPKKEEIKKEKSQEV